MIFANKYNRIKNLSNSFLDSYNIVNSSLQVIKVNGLIAPYDASAIDVNLQIAYCKSLNEFYERSRLAFLTFKSKTELSCYDVISKNVKVFPSNSIGYGTNEHFGYMDSTGTASGTESKKIYNKALLELIENNDLLVFWYKKYGYKINLDISIISYIKKLGIIGEVKIYMTNYISNAYTIIVFILHNKKVKATGIASSLIIMDAVKKALEESKLLLSIYTGCNYSPFNRTDNKSYVDYIRSFEILPSLNIANIEKHNEISLVDWVKTLYIAVLNTKYFQKNITIRCFSEELISCLPTYANMACLSNKEILKQISFIFNDDIPDCPVV